VTDWDSGLVSFVIAVAKACEERKVGFAPDGLPEGVRRLLKLATAVPEKAGARKQTLRPPLLQRLGEGWLGFLASAGSTISFLGEVTLGFMRLLSGRARLRLSDLWLLMQECGANAVGIISLISLLIGMSTALVGAIQLQQFGASIFVANLVAVSMVREMAASMTAFVMAGRTGAAFAAQIGTMQVNEEIDALQTLGVPPVDFLVLPRMTALMLMMPLLYFYAVLLGIIGGAIVALATLNLTPLQYYIQTTGSVGLVSFAVGVTKSAVFGALVAFYGCLCGIRCGRSAAGVGAAATSAVVKSMVAIIVANMLFSVLTNVLGI
jgi:phospholipid/cholesterol/gamma-HCH transport system permease protein